MRRILVPPRPGAFSALGLLCTDVVHDYIRSELRRSTGSTPPMPRRLSRDSRPRRRASSPPKAWTRSAAASCASSTCATPARATSCACRSTGCWQARSTAGARRGARALRRAPRADPRPRRQGTAGRGRELSPARARRRAEISAAAAPPARRLRARADAVKGRRRYRSAAAALEATLYERDRLAVGASCRRPRHRRAVRRHHGHPAGLDRARRRLPQSDPGADSLDHATPSPSRSCATRSRAWSMRCTIISIARAIRPSSASCAISPA